jgi:hypothetical protein
MRHASLHWRGRPSDNMIVKSEGMSTYSAITLTPPSEMSVIVQSRGKELVPNWIFASRLQRRRSLVRRFASISILRLLDADSSGISAIYRFTEQTLESSYRDLSQSTCSFQEIFTEPPMQPKARAQRASIHS